jgi:protein required for attachment to host cells
MTAERVTWVAVLDGAKSLLFEDKGFTDAPDLHLLDKEQYDPVPDREIKTDAPGRQPDTGTNHRSAMEETDFHDQAEQRFVCNFAETLNHAALKRRFDRLIVMAPPRAIGWLRGCLHEETARRIVKELTGDYTNHPTLKLEALLKKQMAPGEPEFAE